MIYTDYPRRYLWRSKLDGSEKLQLTDFYSWMPHWSPDSKKIAFSDLHEIYMVSIDGGTPEKLTSEGKDELAPNWSPDGKSILFNDFPSGGQPIKGIKVLDLATRTVSIMPGSAGFYVPSWAPMENTWSRWRRIHSAWFFTPQRPARGKTLGNLKLPGDTGCGRTTASQFSLR